MHNDYLYRHLEECLSHMVLAELRGVERLLRDRVDFVEAELEKQPQDWLAAACEEGNANLAQVQRWIEKREREDLARPGPPWREPEFPDLLPA